MLRMLYTRIVYALLITLGIFLVTVLHILSFYSSYTLHTAYDMFNTTHTAQNTCVVVFGAAVWPGYFGPVASDALKDRTLTAASLYKQGVAHCIILSGADSIYGAHEVDIMTDILLENDIPEQVIELDRSGVNTRATIEHLDKNRSYILLSNDFHLARIALLAHRAGLDKNGFTVYAATYQTAGRYGREWYFVLREAVAWWYYFFVTLL